MASHSCFAGGSHRGTTHSEEFREIFATALVDELERRAAAALGDKPLAEVMKIAQDMKEKKGLEAKEMFIVSYEQGTATAFHKRLFHELCRDIAADYKFDIDFDSR